MSTVFFPSRNTQTLDAKTKTTTIRLLSPATLTTKTMRVYCEGEMAFLQFGASAEITAQPDHKSIPLAPHAPEVFLLPPKITHIAAITRQGKTKIHLTLGEGI